MNVQRTFWCSLSLLFGLTLLVVPVEGNTEQRNPFKRFLKGSPQHNIPLKEIKHGGPPVDGIPALVNPDFVSVSEVDKLNPKDRLMVVEIVGVVRGYPRKILDHHELVNDRINKTSFLVSWCPLCGSGMVFNRTLVGHRFEFGVSGLLYNSDVLMFDRKTDSLWSQLKGEAVVGELTGTKLSRIPHTQYTWKRFKNEYPSGRVLSFKTGYNRNYSAEAYQGYRKSDRLMFPVSNEDSRLSRKTPVIGVSFGKIDVAVPRNILNSKKMITYGNKNHRLLFIHWKNASRVYEIPQTPDFTFSDNTLRVEEEQWKITNDYLESPDGTRYKRVSHVGSYWFAWATFHPGTALIR
ncbi:MAG: DUF3179 domain-containing protein [bacterium]